MLVHHSRASAAAAASGVARAFAVSRYVLLFLELIMFALQVLDGLVLLWLRVIAPSHHIRRGNSPNLDVIRSLKEASHSS